MYHIPRRRQLQFYDVIFSLVIIRLLGHWVRDRVKVTVSLELVVERQNPKCKTPDYDYSLDEW